MDKRTMKPLQNFVLIETTTKEESDGGIILPDKADVEAPSIGEVVALGDEVKLPIKKGDQVMFKNHLFEMIKEGPKSLHVGREEGIYIKL